MKLSLRRGERKRKEKKKKKEEEKEEQNPILPGSCKFHFEIIQRRFPAKSRLVSRSQKVHECAYPFIFFSKKFSM